MPRVIRSSQTILDLLEIWTYIAAENVSAADRLLDEIDRTFQFLARHPQSGTRRPEFNGGDLRSLTCRRYVIYFRPHPEGIAVARVLHGSRDHGPLLSND